MENSEIKILHVLAAFRHCDGGPPRSVGGLLGALGDISLVEPHLLFGENDVAERADISGTVRLHTTEGVFGHGLRRFKGHGFGQVVNRLQSKETFDLIHSHGLWLKSNHEVSVVCKKLGVPTVISPRGMLEPWALNNRYWKKQLALCLYARKDLKSATAFHATAQSEAKSIRRLGFKQPIAVIPNGVQLPEAKDGEWRRNDSGVMMADSGKLVADNLPSAIRHTSSTKTALFLSRINPKKGLPMLLDAWAKLAPVDWRLVIAGNDDSNHLPVVERKIRELGLREQVEIAGPLFGEAKEAAYRNADIFVLPSYSENFGIVVAEALGYGLPVLTTTGCPWQELETHNCGWWVEPTASGIEQGLNQALGTKNEALSAMGLRGRALVEEKYQWPGIAERMLEFYEWLLKGGKQPEFVV